MHEMDNDIFFDEKSFQEVIRYENKELPILKREIEVLRKAGKRIVLKSMFNTEPDLLDRFSEEEIETQWDGFIDKIYLLIVQLQKDLDISAPEKITIDSFLFDNFEDQALAAANNSQKEKRELIFYTFGLYVSFSSFLGGKRLKEISKRHGWYAAVRLLAHEMRHFYQGEKYPSVEKRELNPDNNVNYHDRLTEVDADLYSLSYLRRIKPEGLKDQLGLWIEKALMLASLRAKKRKLNSIKRKFGN